MSKMFPLDNWLTRVGAAALSSMETMCASYGIARMAITNGVTGDFVECGVFAGSNAAAMARAIWDEAHSLSVGGQTTFGHARQRPYSRKVHLFDTFEGIPQAGPEDYEFLAAGHQEGLSACSLESVQANMQQWGLPDELFCYHPGLFYRTILPGVIQRHLDAIAVLRLDGDLYESTRDAMRLYPLVSPGGWVSVDDFNLSGCRKAIMEAFSDGIGQNAPAPIYWQKARA